jgi:hypothetical protein
MPPKVAQKPKVAPKPKATPKPKPAAKKPAAKKELSAWQQYVKKHMPTPAIQKLPFVERMKAISVMWKGPNAK